MHRGIFPRIPRLHRCASIFLKLCRRRRCFLVLKITLSFLPPPISKSYYPRTPLAFLVLSLRTPINSRFCPLVRINECRLANETNEVIRIPRRSLETSSETGRGKEREAEREKEHRGSSLCATKSASRPCALAISITRRGFASFMLRDENSVINDPTIYRLVSLTNISDENSKQKPSLSLSPAVVEPTSPIILGFRRKLFFRYFVSRLRY